MEVLLFTLKRLPAAVSSWPAASASSWSEIATTETATAAEARSSASATGSELSAKPTSKPSAASRRAEVTARSHAASWT